MLLGIGSIVRPAAGRRSGRMDRETLGSTAPVCAGRVSAPATRHRSRRRFQKSHALLQYSYIASIRIADISVPLRRRYQEVIKPDEQPYGRTTARLNLESTIPGFATFVGRIHRPHETLEIIGVRRRDREDLSALVHSPMKKGGAPGSRPEVEPPSVPVAADEEIEQGRLRQHHATLPSMPRWRVRRRTHSFARSRQSHAAVQFRPIPPAFKVIRRQVHPISPGIPSARDRPRDCRVHSNQTNPVLSRNEIAVSRGGPFVKLEESAKAFAPANGTARGRERMSRTRNEIAQAL